MKKYYRFPLLKIIPFLKKLDNFVLLETNKYDTENRFSYLFINPVDFIRVSSLSHNVEKVFSQIESLLNNYYLAGFFSYELGYFIEEYFRNKKSSSFPLIWLGIYNNLIRFDHTKNKFQGTKLNLHSRQRFNLKKFEITNLKMEISKEKYLENVIKIKNFIRSGDTYQVNYTTKYKFDFWGCPFSLYHDLRNKQTVSYNAFIKTKDFIIISCSPELFFKKIANLITVRPMKGTIKRGKNNQEDFRNIQFLKNDLKNLSENIMIVDLFRNDLGRISEIGSVKVFDLFRVEKYETLFQMSSGIKSKLRKNLSLFKLFKSIFPSGSVTGAPKIKTMEIIKNIELKDRKVYTGGIGFFGPKGEATLNVPIRTLIISKNKGEMGIGSGIVFDSDAETEFSECKLKAKFLTQKSIDFQLIETIFWKNIFYWLDLHLKRLRDSAKYFEFFFDKNSISKQLYRLEKFFSKNHSYKIRLLLNKKGAITHKITKLPDTFPKGLSHAGIYRRPKPLAKNLPKYNPTQRSKKQLIAISSIPTSSKDIFKFHKTTNRGLYNKEYKKYTNYGFFEVIFKNEKGQITEGSTTNIFIKKGKYYYTPLVECGLLNGIYRQIFIKHNKNVIEDIITEKDLKEAQEIYLTNSVKGMVRVFLKDINV